MKKIIIIVIGVIIIVVGLVIFSDRVLDNVLEKETGIFQENQEDIIEQEVVLVINYGDENSETFNIELIKGLTAFDLLKESGLTLETKEYDVGLFVEAIGGKKNGEDEKYWMYYVNGEMPMVSADKKELKPGDKVEFKFEASPF